MQSNSSTLEKIPNAIDAEAVGAGAVGADAVNAEAVDAATVGADAPDADDALEEMVSTPAQVEERRAQQLLERATGLAERGDMAAAILAARQSLALLPQNAQGHATLGGLLERNNNFGGAKAAYEKSLELAPERADFKAKLERLSAQLEQSRGAASQFQFDEAELYPNAEPAMPAKAAAADAAVDTETVDAKAVNTETADAKAVDATIASAGEPDEPDLLLDIDPEMALSYAPEVPADEVAAAEAMPPIEARLPPSRADLANAELGAAAVVAPLVIEAKTELPSAPATRRASAAPLQPLTLDAGETLATATGRRETDRRQNNLPVVTERRQLASRRAATAAGAAAVPLRPASSGIALAAPAVAVPTYGAPAVPIPVWRQIANRPSFYSRTLPLVGVAVLGLGFLGWARGRAVSQDVTPVVAPANPTDVAAPPQNAAQNTNPGAPAVVPVTASKDNAGGFPISNAPAAPAAPAANSGAPAPANSATNGAAPATPANSGAARANRPAPRVASRPAPVFPNVSLAPAPIPPAPVRSISPANPGGVANAPRGGGGGGNLVLPPPQVDLPSAPAAAPARVLPPDNGLNPAGSPNRGFVRVTEGRVGNGVIPAQPEGVARQQEQNASEAARAGQTDQAISQLSAAIRADSANAGFRYQQRASLFMQRGDFGRARDDFQSAISAYQNQIARGDNVAAARRGLNSARSGLNLALAGQ